MITEALIQYVEGKLYTNIDDYTLTDMDGSIKMIRNQYKLDFGEPISAILIKDIISILKLKHNKNRVLRQKVVLCDGVVRTHHG